MSHLHWVLTQRYSKTQQDFVSTWSSQRPNSTLPLKQTNSAHQLHLSPSSCSLDERQLPEGPFTGRRYSLSCDITSLSHKCTFNSTLMLLTFLLVSSWRMSDGCGARLAAPLQTGKRCVAPPNFTAARSVFIYARASRRPRVDEPASDVRLRVETFVHF